MDRSRGSSWLQGKRGVRMRETRTGYDQADDNGGDKLGR